MKLYRFIYPLLIAVFLISCTTESYQKFKLRGNALGTTYSVSYFAQKEKDLQSGFDSIFEVINSSMSTYLKDSKISKLNDGENVVLDEHFKKVFAKSKEIYTKTDGYFDPSIGILVNAYGFGPVDSDMELSQNNIDSVMNYVGFDKYEIENNRLKTKSPYFFIDYNAIAKGYTVDVLSDYIESHGISDYFVELGGEIIASGNDLNTEKKWRFGIEKPVDDNKDRDLSYAIVLNRKALATSGNYRKYRIDTISGKKFVHTINPKTGYAAKSDVLSASVLAEDCMTADAYATAFMAMGFESAKKLIKKENISALLIYVDADNKINSYITQDLQNQISAL
jgi:thiamine biosynthesis lipoprotein